MVLPRTAYRDGPVTIPAGPPSAPPVNGPRTGTGAMTFESVLFRRLPPDLVTDELQAPDHFRDLNLDQIVAAVTKGKEIYNLAPFFHQPLDDADDVAYRQEVVRDLDGPLLDQIAAFASKMEQMRQILRGADASYYRLNKLGLFLTAVLTYGAGVQGLANALEEEAPASRALRAAQTYLSNYVGSAAFRSLIGGAEQVRSELEGISYCLRIRDGAVTVSGSDDEADYSAEIEETFARFRQGEVKDYRVKYPELSGGNHIEAQIAEFVAKLNPGIFNRLDAFCKKSGSFREPVVDRFDREIQFYVSYLDHIGRLRRTGLGFCYPAASGSKEVFGDDVFDLALAGKLAGEARAIVGNDFRLHGRERVIIVSGPNQGGKTTFARTFGQLHYLASLGLPVPGSAARLFLGDRILTHFEREERAEDLRGKLYDDVLRIHGILGAATPQSIIVMNEIFSSTALEDAVFLATEVMRRIIALDCLCVCVSFLEELSSLSPAVVSMVSRVVPEDPAQRTFKIERRPADGRAYAMAIAEKYRLGYRSIRERLAL
jgi:DNA mismatch repair protein MutS